MTDEYLDPGDDLDIDYNTPAVMPDDHAAALERASWHLRMASVYAAERDDLLAVYQAEMERLQLRIEHRARILNQKIEWHEAPVRGLHLALLEQQKDRKTIELPHGTSKVRVPKQPRVYITDKKALLAWAENTHPDLLSRDINVTGVKEVIARLPVLKAGEISPVTDINGEVIPGVEAILEHPTWNATYERGHEIGDPE